MWVITYDGEKAINLEKVRQLRLAARNGEMTILAEFDCASEAAMVAHGDPDAMYDLLEALVQNHKTHQTGVFDVAKWAINHRRVEGLMRVPLDPREARP